MKLTLLALAAVPVGFVAGKPVSIYTNEHPKPTAVDSDALLAATSTQNVNERQLVTPTGSKHSNCTAVVGNLNQALCLAEAGRNNTSSTATATSPTGVTESSTNMLGGFGIPKSPVQTESLAARAEATAPAGNKQSGNTTTYGDGKAAIPIIAWTIASVIALIIVMVVTCIFPACWGEYKWCGKRKVPRDQGQGENWFEMQDRVHDRFQTRRSRNNRISGQAPLRIPDRIYARDSAV